MTRRPVYIAGPYGAPSADLIQRNVARALAVGRLAVAQGHAPVVTHLLGAAGLYGAADESVVGVRETAIACGRSGADMVGCANGLLWAISSEAGSLSEGTAAEVEAWRQAVVHQSAFSGFERHALVVRPWSAWASLCREHGISLEGT